MSDKCVLAHNALENMGEKEEEVFM